MKPEAVDRNGWPIYTDGLTRRAAWSGDSVMISTSRWAREEHPADRSGHALIPTFVVIRRGSYVKAVGRNVGVGDPNHVMYYNPSDEFRISHPKGVLTLGTSFRIRPELLDRLLMDVRPDRRREITNPFPALCRPISAAAFTLHLCIIGHLEEPGPKDALFLEETLAALTRRMMANAYREGVRTPRFYPRDRVRGRIPDLQTYLNSEHGRDIPFQELVDWMGCSPWHLSRVFAEETGVPIYRYLRRVRLRYALGQILQGAADLSRVALDTGFASHSHFTRAFHDEFHMPPSRVRDRVSADRIREFVSRLDQV